MAFSLVDLPDQERFEVRDESGEVAGFMTYQLTGNIVVYTHTEVKPAYKGKGVGSVIARSVMDDARERGRTVVPICPFLVKWLDRHSEYHDIVVHTTRKVK